MTFKETGLAGELIQATEAMGFIKPTAIQEKVIPQILHSNEDLIALAQTGTGKTGAYGLPLIQLTDIGQKLVQTIVLCPTRELCMQISKDITSFSTQVKGFKAVAVYGGADIKQQIKSIKSGCHAVVGTPGRVKDLIRRNVLKLSTIRWVVLDEADEMLNMGFKEDLDYILSETHEDKRVLLFSATMAKDVGGLAKKYMRHPKEVSTGIRNEGAENVRHEYYTVQAKDRYAALKRIADMYPNIYGIVFCRTRKITRDTAAKLIGDGYNTEALHGELSQAQRDQVMERFRQRQVQLLIATDVAARGLDITDLTHVINYDLPDENEVYIHRSGRTARAGKSGVAISIIHSRETRKLKDIERMTGKKFIARKVPTGVEICEKQLFNLIDRVENIEVDEDQINQFLPVIYKKLEWLGRDQLIKHFVSVEFNRFLAYYKNAPDLNLSGGSVGGQRGKRQKQADYFVHLRINLGRKNGLVPERLIGMINERTRKKGIPIGHINLEPRSTTFEVDENFYKEVIRALKNVKYQGTRIRIQALHPGF